MEDTCVVIFTLYPCKEFLHIMEDKRQCLVTAVSHHRLLVGFQDSSSPDPGLISVHAL